VRARNTPAKQCWNNTYPRDRLVSDRMFASLRRKTTPACTQFCILLTQTWTGHTSGYGAGHAPGTGHRFVRSTYYGRLARNCLASRHYWLAARLTCRHGDVRYPSVRYYRTIDDLWRRVVNENTLLVPYYWFKWTQLDTTYQCAIKCYV